jgi:geranylgeranyl pyrophosphate synthase
LTEEGLFGPAAVDLQRVDELLRTAVAQDPPEVGQPMLELFEAGGKRIRPALVLLSAMCGTYDPEHTIPAAMATEFIHAATLVHDDVIDRSPTRRGRPTVAVAHGNEPAIVIGDFYFTKAYDYAAWGTGRPEVVRILAQAVMDICAGEVRQQAIRYRYKTSLDEYMRRIEAKTATLLAACCEIGALLGQLPKERRDALKIYGREIGLAFQIADDVLDYTASEDEVGKPIGHDIAEGFATLPLMLASIHIDDDRKLTDAEARRVVDEVRSSEGPRRALQQAREHADAARAQLHALDGSQAASTLVALADYVVTRKL